jgi:hypothetical protein
VHGFNFIGLILLVFLLLGVPLLLAVAVFRCSRAPHPSGSRVGLVLSLSLLVGWAAWIVGSVVRIGPGQSGIVCRGFSPEGQEYCVVQTFKDFVEPYQVSFYLRDAEGTWQWHYLAHDDGTWRPTVVEFTAEAVRISRKGKLEREIPRPGAVIRQFPDYEKSNLPRALTAADVAADHDRRYGH